MINNETGFDAIFGVEINTETTNYETLVNKPQINNVELSGNKSLDDLGIDIPSQLSELQDDDEHRTVTDEEKAAWNNKANASDIPDELADLNDDAEHRTVTDEEKQGWNGKADPSAIPVDVSDLNNDAGYQTASDVNDAILSNGIAVSKTKHPIGIGINDLASDGLFSNMHFDMNLEKKGSGTPSLSNPVEILSYEEFIIRQYKKTTGAFNLGIESVADGLIKFEGIAPNSNGVIEANGSYTTYAIPVIANGNYKACGSFDGGNAYAWLSNNIPSVGDSVTLLSISQFSTTAFNAGNNKYLFFACETANSIFAVEDADLVKTEGITPWTTIPVSYSDMRVSCRINAQGGVYPLEIAEIEVDKTPTTREINIDRVCLDLSNMDAVGSANNNGVFTLNMRGNLYIDVNGYGISNKLQFVDDASSTNESFSFRNNGVIKVHIAECANMSATELQNYLSTAGIKIGFTPLWDASTDAEIIVNDNISFSEYDYFCCGNRATNVTASLNYIQTPKKLISLIPGKANTSDVIPAPNKPTSNGTYTLKCTKSGSTFTYSWVKDT